MKIFVGNLAKDATEAEVMGLFEPFGEVYSAKIIHDFDTGEPRGFAIVGMRKDGEARVAMKELHETTFRDKVLTVRPARAQNDRRKGHDPNYKGPERRKGERRKEHRRVSRQPAHIGKTRGEEDRLHK
ncbi:MAG: RNA recognition motif domain-containing protein [Candidatus Sumerlaeia bacterium]